MGKATIIHPGFYSSIQDLGRMQHRNLGVPHSGVMDQEAAAMANKLLKNPPSAAVLEMILQGAVLEFETPCRVAIVGIVDSLSVNDTQHTSDKLIEIQAGDVLKIGRVQQGAFIYLAIKGGWQSELVLDSRSMYQGITNESRLLKGHLIPYHSGQSSIDPVQTVPLNYNSSISVLPGPEYESAPDSFKALLKDNPIKLSASWNRMAYVFETGVRVELPQIKTAPVLPGTVQITPSGNLVVLMRDAQSTGGYPRIFQMEESGINRVARMKAGEEIRFVLVE
jgi:biotin-dependent carboxylase-like uncharacterized protein